MILLRNHMHHLNQENHSSDHLAEFTMSPLQGFLFFLSRISYNHVIPSGLK
jgi:hypothetical protein